MKKITSIVAITLTLVMVAGYFSWNFLVSTALESYLNHYCSHCLGSKLRYSDLLQRENFWVIKNPVVETKEGHHISAEELRIGYDWSLLSRELALHLNISNPLIVLSSNPQWQKEKTKSAKSGFFKISPFSVVTDITIEEGKTQIQDAPGSAQELTFKLHGKWNQNPSLQLFAWLPTKEKTLLLSLESSEGKQLFKFESLHLPAVFFSNLMHTIDPSFLDWNLTSGDITGLLTYSSEKEKPPSVYGNLSGSLLKIKNSDLKLFGEIPQIKLELEPNPISSSLVGRCELKGHASISAINDGMINWKIDQILGEAVFQSDGKMDLFLNGLLCHGHHCVPIHTWSKGAIGPLSLLENIHVQLKGLGTDFSGIAPEGLHSWIDKNYPSDEIVINAKVKKHPAALQIEGECHITEKNNSHMQSIAFGVDLKSASNHLDWADLPHWQESDDEVALALIPVKRLRQQASDYGYALENGWIEGKNLPLEKIADTNLLKKSQLDVKGYGDFKGSFDHRNLLLEYSLHDFSVEHPYFSLSLKELLGQNATYLLDLSSGEYFGRIPLKDASFVEKSSGLTFSNVNATLILEPSKVSTSDLEGFCNEIFFAGNMTANYENLSDSNAVIDLHVNTMEGSVEHVQKLLSHLYKSPFLLQIPLEGTVSLRQGGGKFLFNLEPQKATVQAHIEGALTDGNLIRNESQMALRDVSFNFEYDHQANSLNFSEISGALLVGSPKHAEEYVFAGDHLRFSDYANSNAEFDLWIGDRNRDIIRLVGSSKACEDCVEFLLDHERSHFGDVHPESFKLLLKDWSHVEGFNLKLDFQLNTLLHDLQRFSRTGLLLASRQFLKEINTLKTAQGEFNVDIQYDNQTALFNYLVKGNDVAIGNYFFKEFLLNGKKKDATWTIDQLKLDELSIAADVTTIPKGYRLNFLGLRYGESLLAGLEGRYLPDENILDAKLNLLEIKMDQLKELPFLNDFVQQCHPKGLLKALGTIQLSENKDSNKWQIDADLKAQLYNWELYGIKLQNAENIPIHYSSGKGIAIRQLQTTLQDASNGSAKAQIYADKIQYDFSGHDLTFNGLSFKVPAQSLPWVSNHLQQNFPKITESISSVVANLKKTGMVEGTLDISRSSQNKMIALQLNAGRYQILGNECNLNHLSAKYDAFECVINAESLVNNIPMQFSFNSGIGAPDSGDLIISDSSNLLRVQLQNLAQTDAALSQIDGTFSGITVHLKHDQEANPDVLQLQGEVSFDPQQLAKVFPNRLLSYLNGGMFRLLGRWTIPRKDLNSWQNKFSFEGTLEGLQSLVCGYQFDTISAKASFKPQMIRLLKLAIKDSSGTLNAEEVEFVNQQNQWLINMPLLTVKQFKLGMLRSADGNLAFPEQTLVVRKFELRDFSGDLNSPISLTGSGRGYFANPPSRERVSPILQIPSDILNKLGLDLAALSPISGAVDYKIEKNKIILTRFKEMYSAGHLSRFYLAKSKTPPYIDFDGNIRLEVRMKQYNLLFKLAELFTITVEGTLRHPKYSILKEGPQ
jgi:hypothetical protein